MARRADSAARGLATGRSPALLILLMTWFGAAGAALAQSPAPVPARQPDTILDGTITRADHQTYLRVPFDLPAGVDRLVVDFAYDHREDKTVIDLGIEDPAGLRGASGGNKASFTLSATDATPSYLPGPLIPGTWHLALAVPNIREGIASHWHARLWFLRGAEAQALPAPTAGRGPGWYRGDLHLHTAHSDGSCAAQSGARVPCPLFRTLEAAAAQGLDFVAVTEHNTASQAAALREAQPYFDRLLLIPGREITTFYGHFNVFGITAPLDFRIGRGGSAQFAALTDQVHALGGLVSINHPALPSGERCMGCGWTMPGVNLAQVDAIEVINGGTQAEAPPALREAASGLSLWLAGLAAGLPLAPLGGSDNHDPARVGPGAVGNPVTVVEADDLTQAAILKGIRGGRVFVSLAPELPALRLDFTVSTRQAAVAMGGSLAITRKQALTVTATVNAPPGTQIELLDGKDRLALNLAGPAPIVLASGLKPTTGLHALRLALRSAEGALLAVGSAVRVTVR